MPSWFELHGPAAPCANVTVTAKAIALAVAMPVLRFISVFIRSPLSADEPGMAQRQRLVWSLRVVYVYKVTCPRKFDCFFLRWDRMQRFPRQEGSHPWVRPQDCVRDRETIGHFSLGPYRVSYFGPRISLSGILAKYVSSALVFGSPGAYGKPTNAKSSLPVMNVEKSPPPLFSM